MKNRILKPFILLIIFVALLIFPSCADSPDEPVTDNPPSENPPIEDPPEKEEIIKIGMPIHKVISLLGKCTQSDLISTIYYWDTGDDKLLYVWFDNLMNVKKFERRNDLTLEAGMTYSELCDLLDSKGQKEAYAPNVYSFGLASDNKYLHVLFEQTDADNLVVTSYAYRPNITLGMSYEEISTHFNCAPERISIENQIYYCNNVEGEPFIFEFEETDDALTLSSFEYTGDIFPIVDKSYAEICEALGTEGTNCSIDSINSNLYMWETNLNANLYISFNGDNVATDFSYEENIDFVENVTTIEKALFIMGEPFDSNSNSFRWHTYGEMDIYMNFRVLDESLENLLETPVLSYWFYVPHIPLLNGMSGPEAYEAMGEPDLVKGSGSPTFFWYIDVFVVRLNGIYVHIYEKEDAA